MQALAPMCLVQVAFVFSGTRNGWCGIFMLSFGTYPHPLFKSTITTIQQTNPLPERPLSTSSMTPTTSSLADASPSAETALPDQDKFSVEERDFLRSHLPAYRAHCTELDKLGSGPRKLQGVKGDKKSWVYRHVYPNFSRKFSSGSNTQSLKQVCIGYFILHLEFITLCFRNL